MSKKIIPSADTYFSRPGNTLTVEAWEVFKANNPRSEYTCENCWHIHDGMLIRNKPLNDTAVTKKVLIKAGIYFTGEFDRIRITSDLHGKVILVVDYEDDNLLLQLEAAGAKVIYITSNPNYDKNTPDLYFTMYPENYTAEDYPAEDRRNIFIGKNIEAHSVSFYGLLENITNLLKELNHMKIDLVIANPPYGDGMGAKITQKIIQTVDYEAFINLLPLYKYHDVDKLWQYLYLDSVEPVSDGFSDATVTTHIGVIAKQPTNDKPEQEFIIDNFIDQTVAKYCRANILRPEIFTAIDRSGKQATAWDLDRTVLFGWRDATAKHMPYEQGDQYNWNIRNIDKTEFINRRNRPRAAEKSTYELCFYAYTFKTAEEKTNFVKFIYSEEGYKFFSKLFTAMNTSSYVELSPYLPRVDWTRDWTLAEILTEYGYTETELQEVKADLVNYKYMEK